MTGRHPTDTDESLAETPLWTSLGRVAKPVRPDLHLDRIVDTAITLADNAGIEALTMRKVALALDVGTMTLYTYLPGKTELLAAMVETVYRHFDQDRPANGGWRVQLAHLARRHLGIHRMHPWLLAIPDQVQAASPAAADHLRSHLDTLQGVGLSHTEMDSLVNLVSGHVLACARRTQSTPPHQGYDAERDFEFGLQRIMDGTATLIRSRS